MAVSSIDNRIRGKNTKNKYQPKSRKNVQKQIAIDEFIETLSLVVAYKETANLKSDKRLKIILITAFSLLILIAYILTPKITLKGSKEMTLNYNEEYLEKGYKAKFLYKDITKKIKVDSNLVDNKVGKYRIEYYIKVGKYRFKSTRKINVIDNIAPVINTESDILNICPNEEIPDITFTILDEYDGDLTSKTIVYKQTDKLLLIVKDSSNNEATKEIAVDRKDKTAPVITLKGDEKVYLYTGAKYDEAGYTAIDNCDGNITDKVTIDGTVGSTVGEYKLTYSVTDKAGNKGEVTRTVYVRNNHLYNNGTLGNGVIYLTFDDGPSYGTTDVILDILRDEGVKATFFVTCSGSDDLIRRIYNEGHTLALHTCTHDYSYVYSSVDNYFADLNRVSNRVKNLTGYDAKIIRFPGGSSNTVSRNYSYGIMTTLTGMVLDRGYRYYDWNVDSKDAGGAGSSGQVYANVMNNISHGRGNVVLMHDIKYTTRDALRDIIRDAKSYGFTFDKITMDTYMVRHGVNN